VANKKTNWILLEDGEGKTSKLPGVAPVCPPTGGAYLKWVAGGCTKKTILSPALMQFVVHASLLGWVAKPCNFSPIVHPSCGL